MTVFAWFASPAASVLSGLLTLIPAGPAMVCASPSVASPPIARVGTAAAVASPSVAVPSTRPGPSSDLGDDELRALYERGRGYTDFLAGATGRAALWHENTGRAEAIDPELVARARAVGGTWYFLAVAIDACSDSVSTIPFLAELVDRVDGLEMRIVDSTVGRSVMESHRTPDGRAATPTVLLLDARFDEAGCFIERPPALQTWILENSDWSGQQVYERKMAWYEEDGGHDTVEAFVQMLEAAAAGADPICR